MTQILIERTENSYLLIVQDAATGKRKVISVPFQGDCPGFEQEATSVQYLMGLSAV